MTETHMKPKGFLTNLLRLSGAAAALAVWLAASPSVMAMSEGQCVKEGGSCNSWSESCDPGFGFIGLCDGTLKNSACCKPNPGGAVYGGGVDPVAQCKDQKGICVDTCPQNYFPGGVCDQGIFTTTLCCVPGAALGGAGSGGQQPAQTAPAAQPGSPVSLFNPLCPGQSSCNVTLIGLLGRFVSAFLGMVGALALLVFVYAGIMYMTAGSSDRVKTATDTMKYAVMGLAAIMFAYLLTDLFVKAMTSNPPTPPKPKTPATLPTQ